jgi:hypothetical protein
VSGFSDEWQLQVQSNIQDDAAVLLVDHLAEPLSLVQDFSPDEFRNNVLALADTAKYFQRPTILTGMTWSSVRAVQLVELLGRG